MNTFQDKVVGYYKGLPIWAKGLTIIGGGVVIYLVYKKLLAPVKPNTTPKIYTPQQVENIGSNIPYTPVKIALDYNRIADDIFTAMDGMGTYEQDILDAIDECRDQEDWDRVQQAYGVRSVRSGYYFGAFKGGLKSCLANELSSYWINKIKTNLASKRISY